MNYAFTCIGVSALTVLFLSGCATVDETVDLSPKTVTFSKEELMARKTITLPPGYNTDNFRKIRMNVAFESVTGREKIIDSDGKITYKQLGTSNNLSARLQGSMAELYRFTVRSDFNRVAAQNEENRKGSDAVKQDADISLSCKVTTTKEKEKRYNDTLIIYEVEVDYSCEDCATGDVKFSGHAKGRTARSQIISFTGRITGGFNDSGENEAQAIEQAAMKAIAEIANRLGNEFPAGGSIIGCTSTGEKMTLNIGKTDGIGENQICVVYVNDGGVDIAIALAEATPKQDGTSLLQVCKWNESDADAKPLLKAYRANPKAFLDDNKVYAVGYGMPIPPEWRKDTDDDVLRIVK